jgi:hypothetical protein
MIITILHSSADFHAVAYNEKKVSEGLAELIEVKNFDSLLPQDYNAANLRNYLIEYTARNENIVNGQFHVAISCKGHEYTHDQLLDIVHRYLKEMGYADEGQPLLVYAHHDTDNNHIHIITSRIAPDGHKINHNHEKRRSRTITERIMAEYTGQQQSPDIQKIATDALGYRYTSKSQFCAILESQGFDCKDDDDKAVVHIYRNGDELGTIQTQLIMQHALKDNRPNDQRRRQLKAILKKYRNLSANKEELAAAMKKKFGISLVSFGQKDSPYGYALVDHKIKTVFKGSEFVSIRELLQFEDTATRFAKIEQTIDGILKDNPTATTRDINLLLHRQFGTRIHHGTVSWNDETISLSPFVQDQLHRNNRVAMGLSPEPIKITHLPQEQSKEEHHHNITPPYGGGAGGEASHGSNREYEVGHGMNASGIDDEQSQRAKWRR